MNEIAKRDAGLLPERLLRVPALLPEVKAAVMQFLNPEPHAGPPVRVLAPELRQRCAAFAAAADDRRGPAGFSVVKAWLTGMGAGAEFPPTEKEVETRAAAVALACATLPAWAFNAETMAEGLRKWGKLPSAHAAFEFLNEATAEYRGTVRAMRALGEAQEASSDRDVERSPRERELAAQHIRNTLAAFKAEAARAEPDMPSKPTRMAPQLSRATLNAIYARDGITGPQVAGE